MPDRCKLEPHSQAPQELRAQVAESAEARDKRVWSAEPAAADSETVALSVRNEWPKDVAEGDAGAVGEGVTMRSSQVSADTQCRVMKEDNVDPTSCRIAPLYGEEGRRKVESASTVVRSTFPNACGPPLS